MQKEYNKTEDYLKAIQSVGQMIGEVLKEHEGGEKCKCLLSGFELDRACWRDFWAFFLGDSRILPFL